MRETLFNWLGQTLHGRRCLDMFAGSGALGFEAASRGAAEVTMVESNRAAFRALQENVRRLGCANVAPYCEDGIEFAKREKKRYDVIFLDPPFGGDLLHKALPLLEQRLEPGGRVYVESGEPFEPDAAWEAAKRGKAGRVYYQLLKRAADD